MEEKMKKKLSLIMVAVMLTFCLFGCGFLGSEDSAEQGEKVCKVGETIKYGDLEFTFKSVDIYVDNSDWAMDKADDGKEFVILSFEAKNNGESDDYINSLNEDSYCDDSAIDPVSLLFNYDGDTIWGDIAAGRMRKGYVAYEAPIGWEKIELIYQEFLGDKITFVAYSSDVTRGNNSESNKQPSETQDTNNNENSSSDIQSTENQETKDLTCSVGQIVTMQGVEFTFLEIEKYVDTSDWVMDKADDGYEFVILKLKAKNIGESSVRISSFNEDSYCDDTAIDPESLLFNYTGDTIWGEIASNKSREGYVAYQLPIGWEKIEFIYTSDSQKITFIANSSDITE